MRIEKLKQTFEVETVLVHFPLHPETPLEGRSMAELYAGRNVDPEEMYTRMKGLMDAEGLPYGRRTHTYNSRLAQEIGKWADTQPGGEAIHDRLYRAYFVDARNIGDPEVLVEIARRDRDVHGYLLNRSNHHQRRCCHHSNCPCRWRSSEESRMRRWSPFPP